MIDSLRVLLKLLHIGISTATYTLSCAKVYCYIRDNTEVIIPYIVHNFYVLCECSGIV